MTPRAYLCWIGALLLPVPLLAQATPAGAPPASPVAAAPARTLPAVPQVESRLMISAALQVLRLVDADQSAAVWDAASAVARRSIGREAFQAQIRQRRAGLGMPQQRMWSAVKRQRVNPGGTAPAGHYVSVTMTTRFASGQSRDEVVSFRHDEDGQWRVVGYVLD